MKTRYNTFDLFVEILHAKAEDLPKIRKKIIERYRQPKYINTEEESTDDWFESLSDWE